MKKTILITIFMSMIIFACKETPCDVKEDINKLEQYRSELRTDVQGFGEARAQKVHEIDSLNGVLKILDIYISLARHHSIY